MKLKSFSSWLILLAFAESSQANEPVLNPAARSLALANVNVMLSGQGSVMGNPASLATLTGFSCGVHYLYDFTPELGVGAFFANLPARTCVFGLNYKTFGNNFYRENEAAILIGKNLGTRIRAGIGLHYLMIRQPLDYGKQSALLPSLGIQVIPVKQLTAGMRVFNPARQRYSRATDAGIPAVIQAGLGYTFGEEVLICFETEKRFPGRISYRGGIEIVLQEMLILRFGLSAREYPDYSFGLGFRKDRLNIDIAITHHPVLGISPAITLSFAPYPGK